MQVARRAAAHRSEDRFDEHGNVASPQAGRTRGRLRNRGVFAIIALGLAANAAAQANSGVYVISAATVDAGGNAASGGALAIESSIAQPLAESGLAGGSYSLESGFQTLDDDPIFAAGFE